MLFRTFTLLIFILTLGLKLSSAEPSNIIPQKINKLHYHSNGEEFSVQNDTTNYFKKKIIEGRKKVSEAKYVDAIIIFTSLLEEAKLQNDSIYIGTIYSYICLTHGLVGNPIEAIEFANLANSYLSDSNKPILRLWAKVCLGCSHYINNDYTIAKELLTEAIETADTIGYENQFLIYAYSNLADIKVAEGDYYGAITLLNKAIEFQNTYHSYALMVSYYRLGQTHLKLDNTKEAHIYFKKAHDLAVLEPDKTFLAKIYTQKAKFFIEKGDFKRSAYYFNLSDSLNENVINSRVSQEVKKVAMNYQRDSEIKQVELRTKQLEIEKLKIKRKASRLTAYVSILLFVLSVIITILMLNKKLRAQKLAELEHEVSKQKELQLHNFIKGQEEERNRLARDLHDGIGSQMAILKMHLSRMKPRREEDLSSKPIPIYLCDEIYQGLRDVAFNLLPRPLVRDGLVSALQELTRKLSKSSGINFKLNNFGLLHRLTSEQEAALFRIAQEITANIVKHSSATDARVDITFDNVSLGMTVSWNGKGFNPDLLEHSEGHGWKNINTRLNQLEGSIFIDSSPNKEFTTILIDIPNKSQEQYGKTG